jgi:hypothetical protein
MPDQYTLLAKRPGPAALAALRDFPGRCAKPLSLRGDGLTCVEPYASIELPGEPCSN